jgi:glycolate oxidase
VVPRTRVPEILRAIQAAAAKHRIRAGNVFHAGDGNIHPILLFDERDRDEVARVLAAGREILEACIALGGSVTGEHGIGVEKIAQMPLLFGPDDLRREGVRGDAGAAPAGADLSRQAARRVSTTGMPSDGTHVTFRRTTRTP